MDTAIVYVPCTCITAAPRIRTFHFRCINKGDKAKCRRCSPFPQGSSYGLCDQLTRQVRRLIAETTTYPSTCPFMFCVLWHRPRCNPQGVSMCREKHHTASRWNKLWCAYFLSVVVSIRYLYSAWIGTMREIPVHALLLSARSFQSVMRFSIANNRIASARCNSTRHASSPGFTGGTKAKRG